VQYSYPFTVPANTPENDPYEVRMKVTTGILTRVMVYFPPGCALNVRLRIFYQEWQLAPVNRDGYLAGDGTLYTWSEFIPIETEPLLLTCRAWNLDTKNSHAVLVGLVILPRHAVMPEERVAQALEEFRRQIGELTGVF